MKALALVLMVSACAPAPAPALHMGVTPVCQGCLAPYPQMRWSMTIYEVGTRRFVMQFKNVYVDQSECQRAGMEFGNPDIYAVCRPLPNA